MIDLSITNREVCVALSNKQWHEVLIQALKASISEHEQIIQVLEKDVSYYRAKCDGRVLRSKPANYRSKMRSEQKEAILLEKEFLTALKAMNVVLQHTNRQWNTIIDTMDDERRGYAGG